MGLNNNEMRVLRALVENVREETDGDFGFSNAIQVPGLSKHQLAGYVSSLKSKGFIESWDRNTFTLRYPRDTQVIAYTDPNRGPGEFFAEVRDEEANLLAYLVEEHGGEVTFHEWTVMVG